MASTSGETPTMFNLAEALWRTGRRKDAATVYVEYLNQPAAEGQAQFRQFAEARVRAAGRAGD